MAAAVEESGLHKRIALIALNLFGPSDRLLLLGFMVPTAFCSMWISNTATTAMMIPIIEAVLSEIEDEREDQNDATNGNYGTSETENNSIESGEIDGKGELPADNGIKITASNETLDYVRQSKYYAKNTLPGVAHQTRYNLFLISSLSFKFWRI